MNILRTPVFLLITVFCIIFSIVAADANFEGDASASLKPDSIVDYVINFDENRVKKEDMDAVADWLKNRNIEVKENELASYAAYIVAPLNRHIADELLAFGKERDLQIEEIEPDYLDWSDMHEEL